MTEPTKYFVVTKKAVPEVLLKVVEAKRLLESGKLPTIQMRLVSAEALFTNIRMIFSRSTTVPREKL